MRACTRNAYHLYMFRYDPARFAGLPREIFLKALAAEGIPRVRRLQTVEQGRIHSQHRSVERL